MSSPRDQAVRPSTCLKYSTPFDRDMCDDQPAGSGIPLTDFGAVRAVAGARAAAGAAPLVSDASAIADGAVATSASAGAGGARKLPTPGATARRSGFAALTASAPKPATLLLPGAGR